MPNPAGGLVARQISDWSDQQSSGSLSLCDQSELVLPELPKQWGALPPTRQVVEPDSAQADVEDSASDHLKSSKFLTTLKTMFDHLEDMDERFRAVLELRSQILAEHQSESENSDSRVKPLPSTTSALRPSTSSAVKAMPSSPGDEQRLSHWADSTEVGLCFSIATSARVDVTDSISAGTSSKSGFSFKLRSQWIINEAHLVEIAAKGTLEMGILHTGSLASAQTWFSSPMQQLQPKLFKNRVPWHPEKISRLHWDIFAALLLGYDTIMLPLYLFEIKGSHVTRAMEWVSAIFWTLDVVASFCTGVFIKGQLEMRFAKVSKKYVRSWFLLDILMVLVEWTLLALAARESDALSSVGAVRNMRILRFVRLVRLVKFDRLLNQLMRRINSVYLILCFRIIKMILIIVVANHILAGAWYAIGVDGWVELHIPDKEDVLHCYLTSFYWSLTQFHGSTQISPRSLKERLFAVLVLLTAFVAVTWFVSSVTNSMITLQNIHQERSTQQRFLMSFLSQNQVSKLLTIRVKEYVAMYQRENAAITRESDVALLNILPKSLLQDLHKEVRGASIREHPLFLHLDSHFGPCFQQVAHDAVQEIYVSSMDVLFSTGQACTRMLFVKSNLVYVPGQLRRHSSISTELMERIRTNAKDPMQEVKKQNLKKSVSVPLGCEITLSERTWVSEPVLWTIWANCGTLQALEAACMHVVEAEQFVKTALLYDSACIDISEYAKLFVQHLNNSTLSDLPSGVDAHELWIDLQGEDGRISQRQSVSHHHSLSDKLPFRASVRKFMNDLRLSSL